MEISKRRGLNKDYYIFFGKGGMRIKPFFSSFCYCLWVKLNLIVDQKTEKRKQKNGHNKKKSKEKGIREISIKQCFLTNINK